MDVIKLLKNINTLNAYISASREVLGENKIGKIQFNMSSVLALKKIRSYEIEYFNKYEENGVACVALQCMINLTPSKTWAVLGKEIVNLIQYWLDAIRKHLISHSPHWWTFLRRLLNFIKEVRLKDQSLPNLLVEQTAECLLDLATNETADAFQKYEVLHCLNMFCADSNREIRFAMRNKFGEFFVKLSTYVSSCGYFPCQLGVVETLLRWLVPRQDQILRRNSAEKWFSEALYSKDAVDVFLKRTWMDFFQDARDFLNLHNKAGDLIVSVICRRLSVGNIVIIPGKEKHVSWLDINCKCKCLSVVLGPQVLEMFGAMNLKTWETLVITEDNTQEARLDKESRQLTLSVTTVRPPQAHPSLINISSDTSNDIVKIVVSSKTDLTAIDKALNGVFENKYQMLLNLDSEVAESSSQFTRYNSNSDDDFKFSHPVAARRGRRSGYVVRSRNPWKSPSTTSTTSLAQLHDRLTALPPYTYDKEPVRVCAYPELSGISELSETDDRHSFNSATTIKFHRPYGVCYRRIKKTQNVGTSLQKDESKIPNRDLSPALGSKTAPSCLLVATIGSTDDSVISDTMERLIRNKDFESDNIVDLLVKEALEAKPEDLLDGGINTGENGKRGQEDNYQEIHNTSYVEDLVNVTRKRGCTVIRETSDESNTEVISDTQSNCFNSRRKSIRKTDPKNNVYDAHTVEEFFSQHFAENAVGDITISPTLAKKINESSSDTSETFDERITVEIHENPAFDVDKSEVIECLNSIVDKVCEDFDKYTELIIHKDISTFISDMQESLETAMGLEENSRTNKSLMPEKIDAKPKRSLKLKYKISPKNERAAKKSTVTKKRKSNTKKDINAIVEEEVIANPKDDELVISAKTKNNRTKTKHNKILKQNIKSTSENSALANTNILGVSKENFLNNIEQERTEIKPDLINDIVGENDTSMIRRKRKLYSPKDDRINIERSLHSSEGNNDITELKTSNITKRKYSTTFYEEIENERKKYTRKTRSRKSKIPEPTSPRTIKMNQVFDKLKKTVENNEKITLLDKTFEIDVYNFTSDSEEEYFKKNKIPIYEKPSNTTMGSFESNLSTRHGRITKRVNYTENKSSNDESSTKIPKRRRVVKKQKLNKRKVSVEPVIDLEDERMRQAPPEILNTSIIIDNSKEPEVDIEPVLTKFPELESIDYEQSKKDTNEKNKSVKRHKKMDLSLKKFNAKKSDIIDAVINDNSTGSPLPGLVVESMPVCVDDNNDSVTATMLQKFKKIYQDDFDVYMNETNTTHNLLSDVERVNYSPKNINDKRSSIRLSLYNNANLDAINVSEIIDSKSESVASEGINAHGDLDEAPPSPAMIEQQIQPRNLELEDLEQSMKDFFDNLRTQIAGCDETHDLNSSSENLNEGDKLVKGKKKPAKVVVTKLSTEEIKKWVSPDKNSSVKVRQKTEKAYKTSISEAEKSPIVSVSRLSSDEIQKWIPSRKSSVSEKDCEMKNKEGKFQSLYESHKWLPSRRNSSSDASDQNKEEKPIDRVRNRTNTSISSNGTTCQRSKVDISQDNKTTLKLLFYNIVNLKNVEKGCSKNDTILNESKDHVEEPHSEKRSSVISPIKIGNFIPKTQNQQSDDEYMKRVRNIFSENERNTSVKKKIERSRNHLEVLSSPNSTSTKIDSSVKRKSSIERESQKIKVEENHVAESGPSTSSINEWFRRNQSDCSRDEIAHMSVIDCVQSIVEKLDTTLVDVNQNTNRKLISLFVDTQKQLIEQRERRREMYQQAASDMLSTIVKVMDEKFSDLHQRSQEMDDSFMENLRTRASQVLVEDSKQKQTMVQIMKEDVQAVVGYIKNNP